jgi:ParB family chromosome partitioning protein
VSTERRLGRGLEALLGRPPAGTSAADPVHDIAISAAIDSPANVVLPEAPADGDLMLISIHDIDTNPYQPRKLFDEDEINSLADSIRQHGLMQPIVVRRAGDRFQLISGERRWRAAVRVEMAQIPATIREVDDRQVAEMTIVENLQRKDLGPLEKAASFQEYIERYQCTQEELARRLSVDRSTIANLIRLLELPETVQLALRSGDITAGHARALLPLGDEQDQVAFCHRIRKDKLSVRATEQQVADKIRESDREPLQVVGGTKTARGDNRRRQNLASLEQELRTALGTRVELRQTTKGRGRITIHFTSSDEFERLRGLLNGQPNPNSRAG